MLNTQFGNFDGDKWDRICKICFLQKYEAEQYIPVIATPGDYGIEGFTKTGKAFQCYCPNDHYSPDELYQKQRTKITTDLLKLKLNSAEIKKFLGDTILHTWYFVTPQYRKNDIIKHCEKKAKEARNWKLSIIDNSQFNVIPVDIDFLHPHLSVALHSSDTKLSLIPEKPSESDIVEYKNDSGYLVENAQTKHKKRLPLRTADQRTVDKFTHQTISEYLKGLAILNKFKSLVPDDYERFVRIIEQEQSDVVDLSVSPGDDHNQRYIDVLKSIEKKITSSFPNIDEIMVKDLSRYVIADWILRCPLDFVDND